METEKILMGQRELKRWHLMELVKGGKITLREAGEKIGVSYRQAKRIRQAIRDRGIKALVQGVGPWQPGSALQPPDQGSLKREGFRVIEGTLLGL